ncbi:helix-turn-helix transcriptional regulator [Spirosoma sp. SC4-14]|uniref:ArsR/SmtB family transcription factor n=1 Tax=Spirosoma sp. SC4-14 TaxID=3128900 RepID=UPI0030D202E9
MKQYDHPTVDQITLTGILHALSDPVRLNFVKCLAKQTCEQPCGSIPTPVAKSTMSHHLRVLREAGIVQIRTEGTQSLTSLRSNELQQKFPGLLESVLKAAATVDR